MPRRGWLEALPCDEGGLSSIWSQTDTEAPSICVQGTSHPRDSRGTVPSWGYLVGIPQEGTLDIPPHFSALLLTEDKLLLAHVTSRLCVWSQHSRVPWMWLVNNTIFFFISLLSLLASTVNSWLLQTLKASSTSTFCRGGGAQTQDFVNLFWKSGMNWLITCLAIATFLLQTHGLYWCPSWMPLSPGSGRLYFSCFSCVTSQTLL